MPYPYPTIAQWHDYWSVLLIYAPDQFIDLVSGETLADQQAALSEAYEELQSGMHFADKKLKDPYAMRLVRELVEMTFEAYRAGDTLRGAHILQEASGMIWPKFALPPKYVVEAERRAFGKVERYAGVEPSRG